MDRRQSEIFVYDPTDDNQPECNVRVHVDAAGKRNQAREREGDFLAQMWRNLKNTSLSHSFFL